MSWGTYFIFLGIVGAFLTGVIIVFATYRILINRPLSRKKQTSVAAMAFATTAIGALIWKLIL